MADMSDAHFREALGSCSDQGTRTWVFVAPDQLHAQLGALKGRDPAATGVVLLESRAWLSRRPYHRMRVANILLNQRCFAIELAQAGYAVDYRIEDASLVELLRGACDTHGSMLATEWAEREIAAFSPVTEVGCIQVDYFDRLTGRSAVARVLLDECPRDHDLGAEIPKLRPRVDDEKWVEVVKHISMLVHLGRSVYAQVAERSKPLIRRIYGRRADHACADEMKLGVDSRNTTLFVDPRWPVRIGIFIHAE